MRKNKRGGGMVGGRKKKRRGRGKRGGGVRGGSRGDWGEELWPELADAIRWR